MGRLHRTVALAGLVALVTLATVSDAQAQTPTTTSPDQTTTTVLGNEPPPSVPDSPDTVPPRQTPPGEGTASVVPPPASAVRVSARAARAQALSSKAALEAAVTNRATVEQTLAQLQQKVELLAGAARQAVRDLADARDELRARAVDAYVRGPEFDTVVDTDPLSNTGNERAALMSAIVDADRAAVERVKQLQAQVSADQAKTAADLTTTQVLVEQARVEELQALLDLSYAELDLAVSSFGGDFAIRGFVFPVASPHTFTQDFGDPRLPDTEYSHSHEGCDVVADEGTELYAVERGVITDISESFLGGQQLWLKGESGTHYYYAHLSRYPPDLRVGQLVEAGALVGYVGHTGDAYGPHLHFEVHPRGGPAIDPYPILLATDPDRPRSP